MTRNEKTSGRIRLVWKGIFLIVPKYLTIKRLRVSKKDFLEHEERIQKAAIDALELEQVEEYKKELQKRGTEAYNILVKREESTGTLYDKYIITIASASLAASISAVKEIAKIPIVSHVELIQLAWILMCTSIVMIVLSFLSGQMALRREVRISEAYHANVYAVRSPRNLIATVTGWIRVIGGLSLAGGVAAFVLFSILNIDNYMAQEKASKKPTTTNQGSPKAAESVGPVVRSKPSPPPPKSKPKK
jgi:hypothetical protein